jgi:hypothetical protein
MQVITFIKQKAVEHNDSQATTAGGPPTAGGVHKTTTPLQGPACVLPPSKVDNMPRGASLSPLAAEYHPPTAGRDGGTGASLHGAAPPTDRFARTAAEERLNSQLPRPWPPGQGPDTRKGATHFSDNRELPLSIPEARKFLQKCFGKHTGDPAYRCPRHPRPNSTPPHYTRSEGPRTYTRTHAAQPI